jgi:photosystem II stability/assembly factor-like uncharacterized protein
MRRSLALLCVLGMFFPAFADDAKAPPEFAALKYRLVGPYAGGRVSRACGVAGDPLTYYAATASGGVWKSSDGGLNWKSIFDDQPTSSIGSLAVAPSDPNVVYIGTGEANIRGNVSPGAGLFKSEDAGKTWKHVWKQVGQIGALAVHPTNADVCYAAVLGHAFGPNPERGVYRTKDGGKTWEKVLFKNDETGCSDVAIDPGNPRVVFAGFWQARRRPWEMTSGGPGGDLYISRDGGETWTSLREGKSEKEKGKKNGLPAGPWGKIGVAVAPSDSSRVYALIEAEKGGLYRSDDGGETWRLASNDRNLRQRAWYYQTLTVHPSNADILFAPNVLLQKSVNGGASFQPMRGQHHIDFHDLWIDPKNPNRMICANDGGVDLSADGGRTWFAPPLPLSQFYHVHADNSMPYRVMGCMQDLGSASGPSNGLKGSIGLGDWYSVGGGEAGHCVSDPKDPNIVYAGEYGGIMTRYDHRTKQARNITVNQWNPSGIDPAKHKYRFQWTAPILVSKHSGAVFHAGNFLFRTTDGGISWEKVSPDLTRDDKQKQQWSGGPITGDNTGAETYCTIFALAESPTQKGLLWAGSDDGRVHVTRDDCKTWTDVTKNVPDLPDWGTVTCLEASPHDAGTAFLVVDNHRMDDYRPHVWKTTNFGATWTKIVDGLDAGVHAKAVREDPKKKGQLYLGTERGVMLSGDAGATWRPLRLNLPTVPVHDLQVKDDDLVVGTHGRAIWILDDLTVVRGWNESLKEKPVNLYPALPATKWMGGGGGVSGHHRGSSTRDPDRGAVLWYAFAKEPKVVKLEIRDAVGKTIAKASGKPESDTKDDEDDDGQDKKERAMPVKAGLNRFVWDFTHDGADTIPGAKVDAGNPGMGIPVAPGKFTAVLTVDGASQSIPFDVRPDPRFDAKLFSAEQEAFALAIRDRIQSLTDTVFTIRALQKQLALRKELFKDKADAKDLLKLETEFGKKLAAIEEKLHNPKAKIVYDIFAARGGAMLYSQLTWLLGNATDGEGPPTKAQRELSEELAKRLATILAEYGTLTTAEWKKLTEKAKAAGVPELYLPVKTPAGALDARR